MSWFVMEEVRSCLCRPIASFVDAGPFVGQIRGQNTLVIGNDHAGKEYLDSLDQQLPCRMEC